MADGATEPKLGHEMLPYFQMGKGYVNFNHGSFGATPRSVIDKQREYQDRMEAYPDLWFRKEYKPIVDETRKQLSKFVNSDDESGLVMVENASAGVNGVLRALKFNDNDTFLYLSTAYPMVVHTASYLHGTENLNLLRVELEFPNTSSQIVERVRETIEKHEKEMKEGSGKGPIKMALFSHITSIPAIILPIEKMIEVCHDHDITVFIDGAHALGEIRLDMQAIGADFYTGNAHKWLYSPKGTAFLWVAPKFRDSVVPTVISSEFKADAPFAHNFGYTGTRDYTGFCAVQESLVFRKWVGEDRVFDYNHKLALDAANYLKELWDTDVLHAEDEQVPAMVNIRLPSTNSTLVNTLTDKLFEIHNMYVVVFPFQGAFYTRLSAQIYLEMGDFEKLGGLVLKMLMLKE